MDKATSSWKSFTHILGKTPLRESLAEFLGTFILVLIGDGVMATNVFTAFDNVVNLGSSSLTGSVGWAMAVTAAVVISGNISGGHVNPAVTVALATRKKCPLINILPYMLAQYLGAFMASCVIFATYYPAIINMDNKVHVAAGSATATGGIFASYPQSFLYNGSCFVDQVVGTALFLIVICAACDIRNLNCPPFLRCLFIGLGLGSVVLAFGFNCGAAVNPARDLAPRIFTAIAGYGKAPFTYAHYFFWVPVVGPHVGAIIGVWIYYFFIEAPYTNPEGPQNSGIQNLV